MQMESKELLEAISQMIDTKLAQQKTDILDEATHRMKVLLDTAVNTKFNLLAEGIQDIQEKLVPRLRMDDLEDEVKFLKTVIRQMNEDIQSLKKAN